MRHESFVMAICRASSDQSALRWYTFHINASDLVPTSFNIDMSDSEN